MFSDEFEEVEKREVKLFEMYDRIPLGYKLTALVVMSYALGILSVVLT